MDELRTTTVDDRASGHGDPRPDLPAGVHIPQLTRRGIVGVWAAATVPMGLLAWVVAPLVADRLSGPGALPRALIASLAVGLVWQFVLVALLVRREQGTLRWAVVREALWLRSPTNPRTGRRGGRVWLVVPVLIALYAALDVVPSLPHDSGRDFAAFVASDAGTAVLVVVWVFNTVLGEELLFRGYLLPRMSGSFGRADWLANGVLFAGYHVHMWWGIPGILLDAFTFALPSRYFRSALIGIAVHSAQTVLVCALVLPVVLTG